ncbi:MAG: thiazole synthase [Pelagibacteraceae bacterium]|jgi:thiazole synthase|nr:thiazole synthase [Pelagibacteraceae bacterium]MBO6491210.1 thiazole synthase [Pelagibacteraceae bacterium]
MKDDFVIDKKKLTSRLIVGTGKYKSFQQTAEAIKASGAGIVTVAVRRVNITDKKEPALMDYIDPKKITYLPNTAGCFNSRDALRTLRLAREMGGWKLVKLEVLGNKKTLYPNMIETIKSTEVLVKEGFKVMVYCTDDPVMAKKLEDVGASSIMPLAAPIGSGLGIQNKINIKIIKEQSKVPVIVDAGVGEASDATIAMELGCDGVLINSAIAEAKNPILMAEAMKFAVMAGRKSYLAGRMKKREFGNPSSPKKNII